MTDPTPAAVAADLRLSAAMVLMQTITSLEADHPDNRKFGYIKTYVSGYNTVDVIVGPAWTGEAPTPVDVADLVEAGCVVDLGDRRFRPTAFGRRVDAELRRSRCPATVDRDALKWEAVAPHLQSIHDTWFALGAPEVGISSSETTLAGLGEHTRDAVIRQLVDEGLAQSSPAVARDDWDEDPSDEPQPTYVRVRPSAQTISRFGNWPTSPEAAREQLQAAIAAAIQTAPEEDRGRLQQIGDNVAQLSAGTAWSLLMAQLGIGG